MNDQNQDTPALGGGHALASVHETAIAASAAQARAAIEARFLVALSRPRDLDNVRTRLLKECRRPGFAEVARYRRPVGGSTIEGPSIRFAEAAIRNMGNIDQQTHTLYDSPEKTKVRVECTDLETNATYSKEVTITKTVERKKLRDGQTAIGSRVNSAGDVVYIVEADEGSLQAKLDAAISKALRTLSLRLLPGDILDECMAQCVRTTRDQDAKDPDAARKKIADSFELLGLMPSDLKGYVGVELAQCGPIQLQMLRDLYTAIRDGVTSWAEVVEARKSDATSNGDGEKKTDALAAKIAEAAKKKKEEKDRAAAAKDQDTTAEKTAEQAPPAEVIDQKTGEVTTIENEAEPQAAAGDDDGEPPPPDPSTGEVAPEDEPPIDEEEEEPTTYLCEVCGVGRTLDRNTPCAECDAKEKAKAKPRGKGKQAPRASR